MSRKIKKVNGALGVAPQEDVAVPLFGSWRKAYLVVVIVFVVEVAFFYFVSRYFS